jgi:hypothetical protein
MKHIFVFTYNPYFFYVKKRINNEITIQTIPDIFLENISEYHIGFEDKSIIYLKTIFALQFGTNAIKNLFLFHDVRFLNQDPNVFRLFQCDPFDSICTLKIDNISLFLDQFLNIICDHNLDLYSDIINWISFLIQKPGSITETALIIIWEQGTGKNKFFTDIISMLIERYSISNENIVNNIIDRFIVLLRIKS